MNSINGTPSGDMDHSQNKMSQQREIVQMVSNIGRQTNMMHPILMKISERPEAFQKRLISRLKPKKKKKTEELDEYLTDIGKLERIDTLSHNQQ